MAWNILLTLLFTALARAAVLPTNNTDAPLSLQILPNTPISIPPPNPPTPITTNLTINHNEQIWWQPRYYQSEELPYYKLYVHQYEEIFQDVFHALVHRAEATISLRLLDLKYVLLNKGEKLTWEVFGFEFGLEAEKNMILGCVEARALFKILDQGFKENVSPSLIEHVSIDLCTLFGYAPRVARLKDCVQH